MSLPMPTAEQHAENAAYILRLQDRIRQDKLRYEQYIQDTVKRISELETSVQDYKYQKKRISELETSVQQYKSQEGRAKKTGWRSDKDLVRENDNLTRATIEYIEHIGQLYERSGLVSTSDNPLLRKRGWPSHTRARVNISEFHTKQDVFKEMQERTETLILTNRIRVIRDDQFNEVLEAIMKVVSAEEVGEGEMRKALLAILDTPPFTFRYARKRARSE